MILLNLIAVVIFCAAYFSRPRRNILLSLAVALGLFTWVAPKTPWFPQLLINYLLEPIPDTSRLMLADSNVFVVLGSGIEVPFPGRFEASQFTRSRALAAITAYYQCRSADKKCVIIASGGDPHQRGAAEAECIKNLLINAAIPVDDIRLEAESKNTFENAQKTQKIIREEFDGSKIFIVTSSIHMRRSLLYFSYFGVNAAPVVSEWVSPQFGVQYASFNTLLTDRALAEIGGIGRYYIYNLLALNPSSDFLSPKELFKGARQ